MEVILRQTIDNLGRAGQVVKVANGYARNYLLPKKLAYPATPGNMKVIESERQSLLRKDAKQQELAVVALEKIGVWKCRPFELSPTQMAIASRFAARLMDASLIPETEQNDGKILAKLHSCKSHCWSPRTNTCSTWTRKRCCWRSMKRTCCRYIPLIRSDC